MKYVTELLSRAKFRRSPPPVPTANRILVVANFPTNFSESAARRLLSIAGTGARCGVYTLISLDTKLTVPTGVQLKDLEARCVNFLWREGKLNWRDPGLGRLPLTYDAPPEQDRYTKLIEGRH